MVRLAKLLLGGALGFGVYVLVLVILGFVLRGCVSDMARQRLAESLDAEVTVGDASVSLLRGVIELDDVRVTRDRGGHLELTLDHARADIASLGWAVFDREPERVSVRGARLSISARGALTLPRRERPPPLTIGSLHAEDIQLVAMATALTPNLASFEITLIEAETGRFQLRSALDWLFALESLSARAQLPAQSAVEIRYRDGRLGVSGGIFGSAPKEVPFTMPVPDPDDLELAKLRLLVQHLLRALGVDAGRSWLKRRIESRVRELAD